jgi:MYXO-CTERM domain-containing protein
MLKVRLTGSPRRVLPEAFAAAAVFALLALVPAEAGAHFILKEPASWREQNSSGSPQKTGPCGDEGSAAETGAISAFQKGDTITITIDETVHHPGHYRISLATNDRSELPAEPPVTPDDRSECGTTEIQDPPVFPVLADGVFVHTEPFDGPQTVTVKLPDNVTCEKCTLQVLEFMSDHGAPCYYYHCADISVGVTASGGAGSGSGGSGGGAGAGGAKAGGANNPVDDSSDDGCAASAPGAATPGLAALAGLAVAAAMLRRRSARR